jgi:hypothetical protein
MSAAIRARRWSALLFLAPLCGAVVVAGAGSASAGPGGATPPATVALSPMFHPDADHLGSTVRAHEPSAGGQAQGKPTPSLRASLVGQPYGMDVSSFQGNVDWATAARNGGRFVYIKASEATGYVNPFFGAQYNGSAAAGLVRGAYHFALPDRSSGAVQANYFVNNGGGWSPDGRTLPPMLDIEYNPYGATCYGLAPGGMSGWIADFSNTVHARTLPDHLLHEGLVEQVHGRQPRVRQEQPAVRRQLRDLPGHDAGRVGFPNDLAVQRQRRLPG